MKQGNTTETHIHFAVLAVDVVIWTLQEGQLYVRLMRVERPPFFDGIPGLPGGLIKPEETAEQTAKRIIEEKGGIRSSQAYLEQLYTFSDINRDPRGRVVAVAYSAYIPWEKLSTMEREDTKSLWWGAMPVRGALAYDHHEILEKALERLQSRIAYTTLISKLMPREFTLTQLEQAYVTILGATLDKRNFRKKLDKIAIVEDTGRMTSGERWRPAKLYRFKETQLKQISILI